MQKRRLALIGLLIFSIFLIVYSFWSYINCFVFKSYKVTDGVVEDVSLQSYSSDTSQHYTSISFHFTVDGKTYNGSAPSYNKHKANDTIRIYYDENNVTQNGIIEVNKMLLIAGILFGFMSILFLANKSVR